MEMNGPVFCGLALSCLGLLYLQAIFEMMAKYGYNLNRKRRLALYDSVNIPTIERYKI